MYDFEQYMKNGEKILWRGNSNPGKGDKNIAGEIFLIAITFAIQAVMICSVVSENGDGAYWIDFPFIIIFLGTLIFDILGIYSIMNKLFLQKYLISGDEYCVTNKRVFVYRNKKKEIRFGYLINYHNVSVENAKNGYGTVSLAVEKAEGIATMDDIKKVIRDSDKENLSYVNLIAIENPSKVKKIIKEARKVLIDNNETPTIEDIEI